MNLSKEFLQSAVKRLNYYKELGDKTFSQLTDADLHYQPNEASNSIAIIIQHMAGNMLSRWTNFLTEDGEKEWRQRDAEFEAGKQSKADLISLWEKGWECFLGTLASLKKKDLKKTVTIRQEPLKSQRFPARSSSGSMGFPSRRCSVSCRATQGARRTPLEPRPFRKAIPGRAGCVPMRASRRAMMGRTPVWEPVME